jgi:predicted TIM-barrel enzyme
MSKKNSIVPVDQLEFVDVYLTLAVTDCFHMQELFLNVTSALTAINNDKVTMLDGQIRVVDDETGDLKYGSENDLIIFPDSKDTAAPYYVNGKGQAFNEDKEIIFDPQDN